MVWVVRERFAPLSPIERFTARAGMPASDINAVRFALRFGRAVTYE